LNALVLVYETERIEKMRKKDSELFKPLLDTAESYLRAYCDGKQADDEKAKIALRQKVIAGVSELKKVTAIKAKKKSKSRTKAKHRA
jgi:hypothetical protein